MVDSHRTARPKRRQAARKKKQAKPKKRTNSFSIFPMVMTGLVVFSILLGLNLFNVGEPTAPVAQSAVPLGDIAPTATLNPIATVSAANLAAASNVVPTYRVGIVSGHKGFDPGAVCPDGMTEAHLNYVIAVEVVDLLMRRGVLADLLDEFDDRLTGYEADALVSLHSDSCTVPGATGFKVARVTDSAIPEAEDRLVACLNQEYARYTGLPQHPSSITDDMTNYHPFRELNSFTPGAIIEMGFMLDDRYLLEYKPKIVARGVAAGILCFLSS